MAGRRSRPYPDSRPERRIWRETAGDIAAWRDRHSVTDQTNPLGPTPADIGQRHQHQRLARTINRTARQLGHPMAPELGRRLGIENEQDRGFDIGL